MGTALGLENTVLDKKGLPSWGSSNHWRTLPSGKKLLQASPATGMVKVVGPSRKAEGFLGCVLQDQVQSWRFSWKYLTQKCSHRTPKRSQSWTEGKRDFTLVSTTKQSRKGGFGSVWKGNEDMKLLQSGPVGDEVARRAIDTSSLAGWSPPWFLCYRQNRFQQQDVSCNEMWAGLEGKAFSWVFSRGVRGPSVGRAGLPQSYQHLVFKGFSGLRKL